MFLILDKAILSIMKDKEMAFLIFPFLVLFFSYIILSSSENVYDNTYFLFSYILTVVWS